MFWLSKWENWIIILLLNPAMATLLIASFNLKHLLNHQNENQNSISWIQIFCSWELMKKKVIVNTDNNFLLFYVNLLDAFSFIIYVSIGIWYSTISNLKEYQKLLWEITNTD